MFSLKTLTVILLFCGAVWSNASQGQLVEEPTPTDPEPVIEVLDSEPADAKIEQRILSIYGKISGLDQVAVEVESGVVTLTGDVSNEDVASDAIELASRTAGVVTVNDQINRTLDVVDNVRPLLGDLESSARGAFRALPLTLLALGIVTLFVVLAAFVARFHWLWRRITPNPFLAELVAQAVRIAVIAAGVVLALNLVGASKFIATILGGAGVIGIAIGFAVRDTLENYISSIMLSLRQPFRAGDHVVINEHEGYVVRLTSRATILMTLEGNHLRIPNSIVFKGIILNYTTNPERRFDFELGVDANDDPLQAMQVGLDAINQNDFVLDDPGASALITKVGDSSIVITFLAWVDQSSSNIGKARSIAIKSAITALEEQGFTLPEPIYRLRFDGKNLAVPTPTSSNVSEAVKADSSPSPKPPVTQSKKTTEKPASSGEDVLDVSADRHLQDKVNEERSKEVEKDLLDHSQPTE